MIAGQVARSADCIGKRGYARYADDNDLFGSAAVEKRVADINEAFADKSVDGIFTAIGGFNSNDILGLIDPNITVSIIEKEKITRKIKLQLPEKVENVLVCKNPRCISSTEKYVTHVFHLVNPELRTYRCEYCDEIISAGDLK